MCSNDIGKIPLLLLLLLLLASLIYSDTCSNKQEQIKIENPGIKLIYISCHERRVSSKQNSQAKKDKTLENQGKKCASFVFIVCRVHMEISVNPNSGKDGPTRNVDRKV